MGSGTDPLSRPLSRGARLSLPGIAILLVLAAGAGYCLWPSEGGRAKKAAAAPRLEVPPGKLVVDPAAKPAVARADYSPPPLVRLAKARTLADEIHELSRKTAEAQDLETGNRPLIARLEAFHRSAGNLRSACQAAGPESDARNLRAQVELLILESGEIDRRSSALSSTAGRHWKELARRLRELRSLA